MKSYRGTGKRNWRALTSIRSSVCVRAVSYAAVSAILLFNSNVSAQQWVPPENPDPSAIRSGADLDIREGRLALAAEKYLWYHTNALRYQPSLAGVRLSFALGDWRDLADKYPPAMADMRYARDSAEEYVRNSGGDFHAFYDFVALNDVLEEDDRTIALFKWLDLNNRHLARDVFNVAQDALVARAEYALCEKYIVGYNSFDSLIEKHERSIADLTERYGDEADLGFLDTLDKIFARNSSFVIAILVNRDRRTEAERIAERARELLDDETYIIQIRDALDGIPPRRLR